MDNLGQHTTVSLVLLKDSRQLFVSDQITRLVSHGQPPKEIGQLDRPCPCEEPGSRKSRIHEGSAHSELAERSRGALFHCAEGRGKTQVIGAREGREFQRVQLQLDSSAAEQEEDETKPKGKCVAGCAEKEGEAHTTRATEIVRFIW